MPTDIERPLSKNSQIAQESNRYSDSSEIVINRLLKKLEFWHKLSRFLKRSCQFLFFTEIKLMLFDCDETLWSSEDQDYISSVISALSRVNENSIIREK